MYVNKIDNLDEMDKFLERYKLLKLTQIKTEDLNRSITRYCISYKKKVLTKKSLGASLVAQWLRIHLPMQGTQVRALVWEDPTCCGATKPVCHNYWTWALEPMSHNYWSPCDLEPTHHNYWAHALQLLKPAHLEPMLCNKRSHHNEKLMHHNEG